MHADYSSEQLILADIAASTGLKFIRVEGIDTTRPEIARSVLPVLCRWPAAMEDEDVRGAVYTRFLTPHAHPYVDVLLQWLECERDELSRETLVQALALVVTPENAGQVWSRLSRLPKTLSHYAVVAKLAMFPSTAEPAKREIFEYLERNECSLASLQFIATVKDPRIKRWFSQRTNAPDRALRAIARRVSRRGAKLPTIVTLSPTPPPRASERFSAAVDVAKLRDLFSHLTSEFGVRIPPGVRSGAFLDALELDQWAVVGTLARQNEGVRLWLRLEDVDAVEVVLTEDSGRIQ